MHVKNLADEEIVEMTVDDEPTDLLIRAPSLTTYMQYVDEPCLAIVDTGCQRQVAGKRWHAAHAQRVGLPRLSFKEKTMFRFGPHNGSSSRERFAYPAALGGSLAVMFFSRVDEDDPALMSRQCLVPRRFPGHFKGEDALSSFGYNHQPLSQLLWAPRCST